LIALPYKERDQKEKKADEFKGKKSGALIALPYKERDQKERKAVGIQKCQGEKE